MSEFLAGLTVSRRQNTMPASPRKVSTVVLTGAGFSYDAGLPLTKELVSRGREQSKIKHGAEFVDALDEVAHKILKEPIGDDIEAVLTRLKVVELYSKEYSTEHPGSVEEDNYKTKLLQFEMGLYILVWSTLQIPPDPSSVYDKFLKGFGNDVAFASLNYDLLLETIFRRNERPWYYPMQGETKLFDNDLGLYDGSFFTTQAQDPYSIAYLKLHGSFNWYYCWNCEHFNIVRDTNFGLGCRLLRDGHDPLYVGHERHCNEEECLKITHPTIGQAVLKPLIIPPARMKEYRQTPVRRQWVFFDRLLAQAQQIILVGTSVRDEDALLVNSLTLLPLKNPQLEKIVVIDLNEEVAAKVAELAEVGTKWYPNLKAYNNR
jgi:hypothetical protein